MRPSILTPRTICGALAIATLSGTTLAAPQSASAVSSHLRWSNGLADQVGQMNPTQIATTLSQLASREHQSRVLVSFSSPITPNQRALLKAQGLTLLSSLGSTNYFASLDATPNVATLSASTIVNVSAIKRHHKLHQDLISGVIRPWAVSSQGAVGKSALKERANNESILLEEYTREGVDPTIAVIVKFHKDADYMAESARLAQQLGARVNSHIDSVNSAVFHMPASQIDALASDDTVMWAEPPLPGFTELNASNRALTNVDEVQAAPYNLDGSGVTAMIYDGGRMANHADIDGRMTVGASDTAGTSDHATHVGGTVGGDGTASSGNHRGMAPAVDLISYGFEQEGGLMQGFLYTDPGDIEADYTEAIGTYGADLSNNSIGTNTAPNGYPCDWTGNYGITSELIDSIARGSLGSPFRIVWANGNERQSFRCQGDDQGNHGEFYSTAPPACAKNHIAVGSVDSDTDGSSDFSSWGPTDDGRIKPDISAPGCQISADGGVTSLSSFGFSSYGVKCGTSMAAPTVTGISALILQQYRDTFPDRDDLRNSTLKALLANTAEDRGNIGPDYQYGYGSVRADDAIDTVIAQNIIEAEVGQGGVYRFIVIHDGGDLKVTISWDDAPGAPNVSPSLVNDLDLTIIDTNSNTYLPWTLNPNSPNAPAIRSVRDGLNNIEQVQIDNAPAGAYTVEVSGFNIAEGPTQSFGAVANGFLVNCSSAGIVSLGSSLVQCAGTTGVQVIDCDLNTSDLIVDTVDVMISSDSDAGFMLTLTETAPESAAFLGSFTFADAVGSDLLVSEGDSVTASYIDADDGEGNTNVLVESTMTVDCTAPMTISASASDVEARSATLNADFDEAASATFRYGTSMGALNDSVSANSFSTSQSVSISGLTDETSYVFVVDAMDAAGNMSTDNNGGAGYAFTTPDVPDFFTEQFTSGIDLEGMKLTLVPDNGPEGYKAYIESLDGGILPHEPTDGTPVITNADDTHTQFSIADGKSIFIYDEEFTSFWISPNGFITNTSSTDWTETIGEHFGKPGVSALWDDLNPSVTGTVYAQQLDDKIVVSWDRVAEYSDNSLINTFQVELHFDRTIVISWEQVEISDAVVGISDGAGEDPDFIMSDLSTYPELPTECRADLNTDGDLNFLDVSLFIQYFGEASRMADFNGDGDMNFLDVSLYLAEFAAGCP
jgi:subtilase family protein/dockerin type I repeat protein